MKHQDDKQIDKKLEWVTIDDEYSVNLGGIDFESDAEWKKDIELNPNDDNLAELHFEHLFLCVKGNTKLIDEFNYSRKSPCYSSVKHDKIKFNQQDHVDPDHLVKTRYLTMIALVYEVQCKIENL